MMWLRTHDADLAELRDIFARADKDGDGKLKVSDFRRFMTELDPQCSVATAKRRVRRRRCRRAFQLPQRLQLQRWLPRCAKAQLLTRARAPPPPQGVPRLQHGPRDEPAPVRGGCAGAAAARGHPHVPGAAACAPHDRGRARASREGAACVQLLCRTMGRAAVCVTLFVHGIVCGTLCVFVVCLRDTVCAVCATF